MRRIAVIIAITACVVLFGMIAIRTIKYGPPAPATPVAVADVPVDPNSAARRLAEALRIRTVSPGPESPTDGESFVQFRTLLERNYPTVHRVMSREIVADHSLLFTWKGLDPEAEPVLFSAHMDVVPADDDEAKRWTHPPFDGVISDGYVWGRGALDMKQSLIGFLEAAELLIAAGFAPERTMLFAFSHDEEVGSLGAQAIAAFLRRRDTRLALTLDEGLVISTGSIPGIASPVAVIGISQKGYATVEMSLSATGGHASMPPGDPLVARMAKAIAALADAPPPARLGVPADSMLRYLGPELPLIRRVALANQWLFEHLVLSSLEANAATNAMIRTTLAPTMISASATENVLPQKVRAVLNVRILPGDSLEGTLAHMRNRIADDEIKIRSIGGAWEPSPVVDPESRAFRKVESVVRAVFPDAQIAPGLMFATSDTRRYVELAEQSIFFIPSRLHASDLDRIHGVDERISIENYVEIVTFYATLMRELGTAGSL